MVSTMLRFRISLSLIIWLMSSMPSIAKRNQYFHHTQHHHGQHHAVMKKMSPIAAFANSTVRSHRTAVFKTFSSTVPSNNMVFPSSSAIEIKPTKKKIESNLLQRLNVQDLAIYLTYFCTMVTITLPVVLIPMIAADPVLHSSNIVMRSSGAELMGKIVALSSIGAGLGKVLNGFVCQGLGSRLSGSLYLLGMAAFSILLSTTSSLHALAIAGMEFCASIIWPVCNVLIANKYGKDPKKFASAITILSLGSTAGCLSCKVVGSALLTQLHWRNVVRVGAGFCILGSSLLHFVVKEKTYTVRDLRRANIRKFEGTSSNAKGLSFKKAFSSIIRVVSDRMFWFVAAAHTCNYLARSCDKMLGTHLNDITQLSRPLCGSLTSLVTVGLMLGLITGRKMESMTQDQKEKFIIKRQIGAVVSAFSIALMSTSTFSSMLGNKISAAMITVASGTLASSLAAQFYQFPSKFAQKFGDDKAICISFLDAVAFFVASPIWKSVSNIVTGDNFVNGWSVAWMMLTAFFTVGTGLTIKTLRE